MINIDELQIHRRVWIEIIEITGSLDSIDGHSCFLLSLKVNFQFNYGVFV